MAEATGEVYAALPPEDQRRALVFGESYGHAGALDLHGEGLPPAISASSSFYLWEPPEENPVVVFWGFSEEEARRYFAFDDCETDRVVRHPLAREGAEPIVTCRSPKRPLRSLWPSFSPW